MNDIRLAKPLVLPAVRWRQLRTLLRCWIVARLARQRQRRALAALDERLLRDIGVSAEAARIEVEKPIWRD